MSRWRGSSPVAELSAKDVLTGAPSRTAPSGPRDPQRDVALARTRGLSWRHALPTRAGTDSARGVGVPGDSGAPVRPADQRRLPAGGAHTRAARARGGVRLRDDAAAGGARGGIPAVHPGAGFFPAAHAGDAARGLRPRRAAGA